ncbi:hypothetical protein ADL22_10895 [Streptomyces sp. NRRL F-4489]|uniref:hypothetical protein n=1 Tax=Streptomyces sp. NRRL F-4489 TaxID=1609095 RepID=UPI000747F7B3|nr:hypothetical protein [Streptomyces sp. NRRL F-4489]KUL46019.1 hypothetical protein ADL22_10895 [Streptomyces sp. NRRL F-4489]
MSALLVAAAAIGGVMTGAAAAHAADKPPFPYADCIHAAVKQKGESPKYARWHCNLLVQKGWVKKPGT